MAKAACKKPRAWTLEEKRRNVHLIRYNDISTGWEQWALLQADEHWDNPKSNWDLLKRHHDEALKRDAVILKFGDLFCAMQGKFDKRSAKSDIRPEHTNGEYLDSLVSTAADWYKPYAQNIALLGDGNHETSIKGRHETDLLERLSERLRSGGGITRHGGYFGWVRFMFTRRNSGRSSFRLAYNHGWGGGGPVTKGLIDFNRLAEWADADMFVTGHIHTKNYTQVKRLRLSDSNEPRQDTMHYVRCGSYKDEFQYGEGGWHVERGQGPRPLGGWWLRFYYRNEQIKVQVIDTEE
jgi:hypothetical protein